MGSLSALPALDLKTPEQPDLLQKYAQLTQLRGAQQQQAQQAALAPIQQQSAQTSLQEQQQALKDQQAITAAMGQLNGRDLSELPALILKNGGSGQAVIAFKQKQLDLQSKAAETFKNQADGGKAQVDALKTRNDQLAGALTPLTDATKIPDAQLPQALSSAIQSLTSQGTLTPQDAQAAEQLRQQGDPNAIRSGLKEFINSHQALSQTIENAQKEAATAKDTTDQAAKQAEADYYKTHGGAPGVPTETVQMNDWLAKHPGQGPSDYEIAMKKISPGFTFALQQQAAQGAAAAQGGQGAIDWNKVAQKYGMTPSAFDQTAEKYASTGQLPSIGRSANAIAMNRDLMNRAAELHPNQSLAENSAEYKANSQSLQKLQGSLDTVSAFEGTANKNIGMLENIAKTVPDLGARFANVPVRMLSGSMIGTDNMAAFKTALAPVQAESAKILNSANLSGQLSDSSRKELQDIVDGNLPYSALVSSLNVLQQDFKNRQDSTQDQINNIKGRLGSKAASPSGGSTSTPSTGVGSFIMQGGHKFKVTAVDSNGKPTAADAVQ